MGRKKRTDGDANGEAPSSAGHNLETLTEDQRYALTVQHRRKYETALAAKRKADAELKNVCKIAHAELGDTAIDDIKDMIAGSTPEGEEALLARMRAEEERRARMARWLGLAPGAQPSMFEDDRTPASDRAFAEGKRIGLAGDPCAPPYDPNTEQHRRWMEGFHEGQAVLARGFKKPTAQEAAGAAAAAGDARIKAVSAKLAEDAARADEALLTH